jgi:dTDP-L-rhamnose 4-epimerase
MTSPLPTSRRSTRTPDGFTPANVCSGRPISILEMANELCEARGDVPPVATDRYRSGDVQHIVATPAGASELLGFRAVIEWHYGLREFAYAPLIS